jgi:hypothetical protein
MRSIKTTNILLAGYVRLRRLDETPYSGNSNKNIGPSSTADDDEIYYGDSESIIDVRNLNMTLPDRIKKSGLQTTTLFNAGSLPNLQDDETIYEDQVSLSRENIYGTRTNHDIKVESDCEHMSSMEDQRARGKKSELEIRKGSYQRHPRYGPAKLTRPKVHRPASSSSSGYRSGAGDSDSEWSSVMSNVGSNRNLSVNHAAADARTRTRYSNTVIPAQCFKKVRLNSEGRIYTTRQERKQPQNSKQLRLMMADRQYDCDVFYTSSESFMSYFIDLFINQLAKPLGFKPEDLNHVQDSIIHCDKVINSHSPRLRRIESYEITPTISLQWPEDAQEWLDRPRSTWPNYDDINKVKDFGSYVIPEDSMTPINKDFVRRESRQHDFKKNINHEIEWQLIFPAAERYLETCMTHSQVQVYLIALMLHKTFLRPVLDTTYGLTISHIRNKLFWLIEENDRPSKWPDNRTGECLLKLLHSLYHCISQNDPILPDYFVRDKNMFKKVPNDYLLHSQKQLKRIIENPIMYVFHAMENIKHSDKFFPRLDFTMLFKILTVKPWLALVNPALDMFMPSSKAAEESQIAREEIYNRSSEFWMSARMRSEQTYSGTRVVTNKTLITPRKATYSIVEITVSSSSD